VFLYFKFLERDGNRGLGLLPLYSLDWIGLVELVANCLPKCYVTYLQTVAMEKRNEYSLLFIYILRC